MGSITKKSLKNIKGYENKKTYTDFLTFPLKDDRNEINLVLKNTIKRTKIVNSIEEAIIKSELKDGMTISFHHAFRNGDKTLPLVMKVIEKMGFKNLKVASSSLTKSHGCLVDCIKKGIVTKIETSGLRGELGIAISEGILGENPAVIRSHGGRARAIVNGDLKIDVAFLAAPSSDCMGNANGTKGKTICGALGYGKVDAKYGGKVIVLTDTLVDYPNNPISISQTDVDYVVLVEEIGDSKGIMSGATRYTTNPKEILMAKKVLETMITTGLFVEGFSMQTGAGGAALAVTRFIREELIKRNIKMSFALGGITKPFIDLLEEGLLNKIYDTQSFDLVAAEALGKNEKIEEISTNFYANPWNCSPAVNKLDFGILGALEVDINFNVNVISGSDGVIMEAVGGHQDIAAGSKIAIVVVPLVRGRIATIVDRVTTLVTPGDTIDILVTDYGVAINPQRKDLIDKFIEAKVEILTIEELREIAKSIVGKPKNIEFEEKIVAVVEYRDGSIIDVVRKLKK